MKAEFDFDAPRAPAHRLYRRHVPHPHGRGGARNPRQDARRPVGRRQGRHASSVPIDKTYPLAEAQRRPRAHADEPALRQDFADSLVAAVVTGHHTCRHRWACPGDLDLVGKGGVSGIGFAVSSPAIATGGLSWAGRNHIVTSRETSHTHARNRSQGGNVHGRERTNHLVLMPRRICGRRKALDWKWVPGRKPQLPDPFTIEKLVALMDEGGVDRAVIVPPSWPEQSQRLRPSKWRSAIPSGSASWAASR